MFSFAKRSFLGCLLLLTNGLFASLQGLMTKDGLKQFLSTSTKVALVQDALMFAGDGFANCHQGKNKADAKEVMGWLRTATDVTQVPNEVVRMALEEDKDLLQAVVHALAKELPHFTGDSRLWPMETLRVGLWPLLYALSFNKVNQFVHALWPEAGQEWQRRVARTFAVLGLYTIAFGANKCLDKDLNVRDAWGAQETKVIEHICYEIAGAILASEIIVEDKTVETAAGALS